MIHVQLSLKLSFATKIVNTFFPSFHPPAGHLLRVLQDVDFGASDQIISSHLAEASGRILHISKYAHNPS